MITELIPKPTLRLTPAVIGSILQRMKDDGVPFATAAQLAGIPSRTAQQWQAIAEGRMKVYQDGTTVSDSLRAFLAPLAEQIADARAHAEAEMLQTISNAARTVNSKTGLPEWRAAAWRLEHAPDTKRSYSEFREQRIEHTGTVNVEHRIAAQMSEPELLEALPAEWREMVPATETATDGESEHEPHI